MITLAAQAGPVTAVTLAAITVLAVILLAVIAKKMEPMVAIAAAAILILIWVIATGRAVA